MTPEEKDIALRVFELLKADKTLKAEAIITRAISQKIKKRINELLASHPDEFASIIEQHVSQTAPTSFIPDPIQDRRQVTIPENLKRTLTKTRLHLLELLLDAFRNNDFADYKTIMKEIYNEDKDDDKQIPIKLRCLASTTKRSIQGWGDIRVIQGKGYRLIINGIE